MYSESSELVSGLYRRIGACNGYCTRGNTVLILLLTRCSLCRKLTVTRIHDCTLVSKVTEEWTVDTNVDSFMSVGTSTVN
jgi:hypothetical protein